MKKLTFFICLLASNVLFSYQLPTTALKNKTIYDFVITKIYSGQSNCHVSNIDIGMTWKPGETIYIEGDCEPTGFLDTGLQVLFNVPYASKPYYGMSGEIAITQSGASVSYPSRVFKSQTKPLDGDIKYNLTLTRGIELRDGVVDDEY